MRRKPGLLKAPSQRLHPPPDNKPPRTARNRGSQVWAATLGLVMGIPGAIFTWRWPEPVDLALLAAMGVLGTITQGCYIKGMAIGDAAAMAPIDYIRLVFTVIVGVTLFHEIPTIWTIAGAGVVVASTLLITWREAALSRAARRATAADEASG